MIQEVIYTSVPKGLDPERSGYCVVARSKELDQDISDRLVLLSSFRIYDSARGTPTNYSHQFFTSGPQRRHVLTRVGDGGTDHTGRRCLFAHHICSTPTTRFAEAGPAWVCASRSLFLKQWKVNPGIFRDRQLPVGKYDIDQCKLWKARVGNSDFAELLAKKVQTKDRKPIYIAFEPELRMLPLLVEAIALVPKELRWKVTFSTLFTQLVPGFDCMVRCVVKGSDEHSKAEKNLAQIIDLTGTG